MLSPKVDQTLSTIVDKAPLSETTLKAGRQLLIVAGIAILLTVYGVTISVPIVHEFAEPNRNRTVLTGALSVVLVYLFIKFWIDVFDDLARWYHARDIIALNNWYGPLTESKEQCNRTEQLIDKAKEGIQMLHDRESQMAMERWMKHGDLMLQQARDITDRTADQMASVLSSDRTLKVVIGLRFGLDLGAPTLLGALAIWKVAGSFAPFLKELLRG